MECNFHQKHEKTCIEIVPIFSSLSHEEMMEVAGITAEKTFEKGEMIYSAGDKRKRLYVIHKGKVKVTRISESGKEQIIRILGPGEFLGELSLFSVDPLTDNSEAIEKVNVCVIDGQHIKELMTKHPSISFKVMDELSKRLAKAENLIENISLRGAEKRLADMLISLGDDKGKVVLKMSKRDLASHLGMSQETLSRKLSHFQDLRLIKLSGQRQILLLDLQGLKSLE